MASSSGVMRAEQPGSTRDNTLKALMNDLICLTVVGAGQEDSVAIQWGLALSVPREQIQTSIVVEDGLMTVFDAANSRSQS